MDDKIDVTEGDMFDDPWPQHCDVHLLSNLLHDWDFPEIEKILRRSAESMPAGGLLIIHQAFLNDEKSGPVPTAEYSTLIMNITRGRCYSRAELLPLLRDTGFEPQRVGKYSGEPRIPDGNEGLKLKSATPETGQRFLKRFSNRGLKPTKMPNRLLPRHTTDRPVIRQSENCSPSD